MGGLGRYFAPVLGDDVDTPRGVEPVLRHLEDGHRHRYDEDNKVLATDILRATESVGRGIMGSCMRISYALLIAHDLIDLRLEMWALSAAGRYLGTANNTPQYRYLPRRGESIFWRIPELIYGGRG